MTPTNPPSAFKTWLSSHGCTKEELWKIQNMLGDVMPDTLLHQEAVAAWIDKVATEPPSANHEDVLEKVKMRRNQKCPICNKALKLSDFSYVKCTSGHSMRIEIAEELLSLHTTNKALEAKVKEQAEAIRKADEALRIEEQWLPSQVGWDESPLKDVVKARRDIAPIVSPVES